MVIEVALGLGLSWLGFLRFPSNINLDFVLALYHMELIATTVSVAV